MRMLALICFAAMMCGLNAQTPNDTGAMHIAGPLLKDYNSMQATLESASHYLAKVVQAEALKSPSEAQEIENLLVVMYTPLVVKAKTDLANTAFGGPMADRGRKMVGAFKTALEGLNDGSYIRTRFVAQYVREHDIVKRCFRMKSAVRRLEHKKFAVKLRGFDDAYGEYMKLLADWERGKGSGIDHLVLSFAWMDGDAMDDDIRMGGVEVLIGDLFAIGAIDGIGESGPEFLGVEVERASADFFIDREGEADWVVLNLRVALVIGKDGHDDGDAGFIVSA